MANEVAEETVKECDRQHDSLYVHFGKFLYENIEMGNISYCFESENSHLEEEADTLLLKIKYQPDFEERIPTAQIGPDSDKLLQEENSGKETVNTEVESAEEESEEIEEVHIEEEQERDEDEYDYGLLETASRKLKAESATEKEKLHVLNAIFRSVPDKVGDFLFDLVKDADLLRKKELVDLLKKVNSPTLAGLYRKFTDNGDSLLRLHGIMGLRRLVPDETKDVIVSAVHDRDPQVRRLAANCIDYTGEDTELAAIVRLANDADETVARIATRKLGRLKNHLSFINLIQKLESSNTKVRKEAIDALRLMVGKDLGYDYSAPESKRKAAIKNWRKFWEKNLANPHFLKETEPVKSYKRKKKSLTHKVK